MEGMGLIFTPAFILMKSLRLSGLSGLQLALSGLIAMPNSPLGRYILPLAAHSPPPPSPLLLLPVQLLIHTICDITVVVKTCSKSSSVT